MTDTQTWQRSLIEANETLAAFLDEPNLFERLGALSEICTSALAADAKILACGNGGSHCDAMHFCEELTGRYRQSRPPLGAIALGDASHMSCVSNDYGFEHVFERQIQGIGRSGDVLLIMSTSGNSPNLILAVEAAKTRGMKTIALLGRTGGALKDLVDFSVVVPGANSDRIQELHIKLLHILVETIERRLFPRLYEN